MNEEQQESYDMECVDCNHKFDVSDAPLVAGDIVCPRCGSNDVLDLTDEY